MAGIVLASLKKSRRITFAGLKLYPFRSLSRRKMPSCSTSGRLMTRWDDSSVDVASEITEDAEIVRIQPRTTKWMGSVKAESLKIEVELLGDTGEFKDTRILEPGTAAVSNSREDVALTSALIRREVPTLAPESLIAALRNSEYPLRKTGFSQ
eukprot:GHVT01028709.1.p2 GENE.GHVT01028709.1~~GHVT01028709.1.p2  ORF type:complete len:153 (-),score=2.23 GHVT01028709.1:2003-2461(-)